MGQLTELGQEQALALGWELRHRYVDVHELLPAQLDPPSMYLRSTNIQRTLATAAGVLTGMYPPAAPENGGAAGGGAEVA